MESLESLTNSQRSSAKYSPHRILVGVAVRSKPQTQELLVNILRLLSYGMAARIATSHPIPEQSAKS